MRVRLWWFRVRAWTEKRSRSYGLKESECAGSPQSCYRRKSLAGDTLFPGQSREIHVLQWLRSVFGGLVSDAG